MTGEYIDREEVLNAIDSIEVNITAIRDNMDDILETFNGTKKIKPIVEEN